MRSSTLETKTSLETSSCRSKSRKMRRAVSLSCARPHPHLVHLRWSACISCECAVKRVVCSCTPGEHAHTQTAFQPKSVCSLNNAVRGGHNCSYHLQSAQGRAQHSTHTHTHTVYSSGFSLVPARLSLNCKNRFLLLVVAEQSDLQD